MVKKSTKLTSLSTTTVRKFVHFAKISKYIKAIEAAKKKLEEELSDLTWTNPVIVDWVEEKDGTITLVETLWRKPEDLSLHGNLEYACYRLNATAEKYEEDATLQDLKKTRKGRKYDKIPPLKERVAQFKKKV